MKILFVCGCMEPGKDGVGDYTRLLSAQLIRKNHEVAVIALKDYFTNSSEESEQVVEGEKVSVLRIEKSHFQLSAIAQEYIQRFDPEWISLQYVPYSFHKKGLPLQLPGLIRKLLDGRKCHLMLHELWLGISEKSPLRQKAIGYIQRLILKNLVAIDAVKNVSTSNVLYAEVLNRAGINSDVLQLFSNIPITELNEKKKMELLNELGLKPYKREEYMISGIFGSLYEDSNLDYTLRKLVLECSFLRKKLVLISIGRLGETGLKEWRRVTKLFEVDVVFLKLGEQSAERVSQYFQIMDIGISCTPAHLLGKSGVFAAMKLHGLQIETGEMNILPGYERIISNSIRPLKNSEPLTWDVSSAADKFLNSLESYSVAINDLQRTEAI